MWLHFEYSAPYSRNLPLLISDIEALWHYSQCGSVCVHVSVIREQNRGGGTPWSE